MANRGSSPYITTGERLKNFIGWAFVISIGIHFLLAPVFPNLGRHSEDQTVEKVSVTKKVIVKVPTPPPPTPTPPPTPPPKSTPPPQKTQPNPKPLVVNLVHQQSHSASGPSESAHQAKGPVNQSGSPGGTGTAAPGPVSTVAPGPPATPKPACKTPYQDATVVQQVSPEYPDAARELGLGQVTVTVQVTVGPSGSLQGEKVAQSAGNMSLDNAAMSAARQSTYAPKVVNCQPVTGDYYFKVTFDPNS